MGIIQYAGENLDTLTKNGTVIFDFYADWCGPCKMIGPMLEELSKENSDLTVVKINVDEHEKIAQQFGVMSIPTLVLFKNSKMLDKKVGFQSKEFLEDWIR